MSAHERTLVVDDSSSEPCLAEAAQVLERCEGVVVLDGVAALRATPRAIVCEVIDPMPGAHRCAEEFKVLLENAGRALAGSRLAGRLPGRPLHWVVVERYAAGAPPIWPAP